MAKIPINDLKTLAKKHKLTHVCLYAYDQKENTQHVVTYGTTQLACDQIAQFGDKVKKDAGWPENLNKLPSRVKKFRDENDALKKENEELKKKLEQFEYKFAVDVFECERGWGQKLLHTKKFKTEQEANAYMKEENKRNSASFAPDYYFVAREPRKINRDEG